MENKQNWLTTIRLPFFLHTDLQPLFPSSVKQGNKSQRTVDISSSRLSAGLILTDSSLENMQDVQPDPPVFQQNLFVG